MLHGRRTAVAVDRTKSSCIRPRQGPACNQQTFANPSSSRTSSRFGAPMPPPQPPPPDPSNCHLHVLYLTTFPRLCRTRLPVAPLVSREALTRGPPIGHPDSQHLTRAHEERLRVLRDSPSRRILEQPRLFQEKLRPSTGKIVWRGSARDLDSPGRPRRPHLSSASGLRS